MEKRVGSSGPWLCSKCRGQCDSTHFILPTAIDQKPLFLGRKKVAPLAVNRGKAVYSVIQTGFVYAAQRDNWTVQLIGTRGALTMGGYAWEPEEVSLYRGDQGKIQVDG